jgi:hypothetical protein
MAPALAAIQPPPAAIASAAAAGNDTEGSLDEESQQLAHYEALVRAGLGDDAATAAIEAALRTHSDLAHRPSDAAGQDPSTIGGEGAAMDAAVDDTAAECGDGGTRADKGDDAGTGHAQGLAGAACKATLLARMSINSLLGARRATLELRRLMAEAIDLQLRRLQLQATEMLANQEILGKLRANA